MTNTGTCYVLPPTELCAVCVLGRCRKCTAAPSGKAVVPWFEGTMIRWHCWRQLPSTDVHTAVTNTWSALQLPHWFIFPPKIGNNLSWNLLQTGDELERLFRIYILNSFTLRIKIFLWNFNFFIFKASENILRGPLPDVSKASDEVDGEHEAVVIDSERLEPRSDEDDTYVLAFMFSLVPQKRFFCKNIPLKRKIIVFFSASKSIPLLHNEIEINTIWYLTT